MVHWCGAQYHDLTAEHADLHTDLADLEAKENQLDDLIRNAELQLKLLNEDKTNAYVTYQVHILQLMHTNEHKSRALKAM